MNKTTCPACGAAASGNFCSICGAGLSARVCASCNASLSSRARFCHRCGRPVVPEPAGVPVSGSERKAWIIAGTVSLLLVAGIVYQVSSSAPEPAVPDMANPGVISSGQAPVTGPAPDISRMSPRERFDRLFNRIMQASERRDSVEIARFTPMALGAYQQLDTFDNDARYHAAVIHLQAGALGPALALADTILGHTSGHLFGYLIRGAAAELARDPVARAQAEREFLASYPAERAANRVEYLEHQPVLDEFKRAAEQP